MNSCDISPLLAYDDALDRKGGEGEDRDGTVRAQEEAPRQRREQLRSVLQIRFAGEGVLLACALHRCHDKLKALLGD